MNIEYMYLFKLVLLFSLGKYPKAILLDHMAVLFVIFFENSILFSMGDSIFSPTTIHEGSFFCTSFVQLVLCCLFHHSHSDRCEVLSHCDFDLHFPD